MKKSLKILMHSLFWFYIFAWREVIGAIFSSKEKLSLSYFLDPLALSHYLLFPLTFYFNYFFILPRYYKNRKIAQAWLAWILLLFAFIFLRYMIQEVLFWHWLGIKNYTDGTSISYYIFDNLYYGGILIIMSTLFWILDDNQKSQKENFILLEEKKTAQLAFLKNQVNPHFIFNTLNNIYSLVSSKSDKALPSIEKLSQLMRYMYKDSDAPQVSLQNEIDYIASFIDLQSIRLSNKESVQYHFSGNISQYSIAPLLLIPFVENMFKHGVLNQIEKPLIIKIDINNGTLYLTTSNFINTLHKDEASGIGLDNVKKRLELLYTDKHTLKIEAKENMYTTNLQIKLG
jgi:two-component system, LytTR family, sensor kinase